MDPTESHNLYGDQEYVLIQEKLKEQFLDLRVKVKAVEINENLSTQAKNRIKEVNEAIDSNWNYGPNSQRQAE